MTPRPRKYSTEEERKEARRESVRKCRENQKQRMVEEITDYVNRIESLERQVADLEELNQILEQENQELKSLHPQNE
jgi:predicted RNase H-like nuclease (RuvC/YqgF family)